MSPLRTPEKIEQFKRSFSENGPYFRTLAIQPLLDEKEGLLSDPAAIEELKKMVLGSAYEDNAVRTIASAYIDVLPVSERKLYLAHALAGVNPKNPGRSLRQMITSGGPLAAKGAQTAATSGLVSAETREDLMFTFDDFEKPSRDEVFLQMREIFGESFERVEGIAEIPGSGSLNYVSKVIVRDPETGKLETLSVRVQKKHVPAKIQNENAVWKEVYQRTKADPDIRVRRYARLIEEARREAISTLGFDGMELDLAKERESYPQAAKAYDEATPNARTGLRTEVVKVKEKWQARIKPEFQKTVSVYEFVENVKLEDIPDVAKRAAISHQIVEAERNARRSGNFDPDAHVRNWLISPESGRLVRIDTAQMRNITPTELNTFQGLFKNIILPGSAGTKSLEKFLRENFTQVFDVPEVPPGAMEVIHRIISDKSFPPNSSPMDRLFMIQDGLEKHYLTAGKGEFAFSLRPGVRRQILSEVRLSMYQPWLGRQNYLRGFARSVNLGPVDYAVAKVKSGVMNCIEPFSRLMRSGRMPSSRR
jgi:hypothetical protein